MKYQLLFSPELSVPGDPASDILLVPVIVDEKGGSFAMKKAVKTVKQAFMFDDGFSLAQFIEDEGGPEGIQEMLNARKEHDSENTMKNALTPVRKDGVPNADEGC